MYMSMSMISTTVRSSNCCINMPVKLPQLAATLAALVAALVVSCVAVGVSGSTVGVCYGTVADDLPPPAVVADLLKSKNVDRVHIYDTNHDVLNAFLGSNMSFIVGTLNDDLPAFAQSPDVVATWVRDNIAPYSTIIRYISVGNEILTAAPQYGQYLYQAMLNLHSALEAAGLSGFIKVSTTHSSAVVQGYPPSTGTFTPDAQPIINQILPFLANTNSPFFLNVYPYFAYMSDQADIALNYALFLPGTTVNDNNGLTYTNLFDAQVDTVIAALATSGFPDLQLQITETGWPNGGDGPGPAGNQQAQTFNTNLIAHVPNGTPRRPNVLLQTYLFSLFNEDQKPAGVEQHWGVYYPDRSPVYPITF